MGASAGGKVTASAINALEITLKVLGTCLGTCNTCHDNSIYETDNFMGFYFSSVESKS